MISIVIPTLNEENYLPLLLESVKNQIFDGDYEIIVADAGSQDKTLKIAENFGCKIIKGGSPPKGKNEGAKMAEGDTIFFVDADIILPQPFLKNALKEFDKRGLSTASFYLRSEKGIHNLSFNVFYNFTSKITQKIIPQAMSAFMVKKDIHLKVGGFDEKIKLGEELDYVRRAKIFGKFGVLDSVKIFVSPRRFKKDGFLKTWMKYFFCQIYMIFFGSVKSDIFKYKFGHYCKKERNN